MARKDELPQMQRVKPRVETSSKGETSRLDFIVEASSVVPRCS